MSTNWEVPEAEVLKLAPSDRSHLLDRLVASLDSDPDIGRAWELETNVREDALATGSAVEVSRPEALHRLRARIAGLAIRFNQALSKTWLMQ